MHASAENAAPAAALDTYFINPSLETSITFAVPLDARSWRHCTFALQPVPALAEWLLGLADELLTGASSPEATAPAFARLVAELDEATAAKLASYGILVTTPERPGRHAWNSQVRLLLRTRCRRSGQYLEEATFAPEREPEAFRWLLRLAARGSSPRQPAIGALAERLRRTGILVQDAPGSACFAALPVTERVADADAAMLALAELRGGDGGLLEALDDATGFWLPANLTPAEARVVAALRAGRAAVSELSSSIRSRLWQAGVLADSRESSARATKQTEQRERATREIGTRGYAKLEDLFTLPQLERWSQYCRLLEREGYFPRPAPDPVAPCRSLIYCEPATRKLHARLTEMVALIVGEPLQPSYCILARYEPGARLQRHVDRAQCVWNLSLVLDAQSAEDVAAPWPLYLETSSGIQAVELRPGQGVIFPGTRVPHWREPLPSGNQTTIAFYHFVPPTFAGPRS